MSLANSRSGSLSKHTTPGLFGGLAGYKKPKSVDFFNAPPRNPTGKILHREFRDKSTVTSGSVDAVSRSSFY